jgi:hypothetical protein
LVAFGPQDKRLDDNTHGKKQEREKVHLEETKNNTAWDNQLNGLETRREKKKEDFRMVRWFTQARPPPD